MNNISACIVPKEKVPLLQCPEYSAKVLRTLKICDLTIYFLMSQSKMSRIAILSFEIGDMKLV